MTEEQQNKPDPKRKLPAPVQMALQALQVFAGEDKAAAENMNKLLPAFALKLAKDGGEVTVEILLDHARQGVEHLAASRSSAGQKLLTYAEVVAGLKTPVKKAEDENEENEPVENLIEAALADREDALRKFIAEGADVNIANEIGTTALIMESLRGNNEMVKLLLDHGAKPNAGNTVGNTPLMMAAKNGHTETVRLLLEGGARIDAKNAHGDTALMWGVSGNHPDIVQCLIDTGANIDAANNTGITALIVAVSYGYKEIVLQLLANGADVNIHDKNGDRALMYAVNLERTEILQHIIDKGGNMSAVNNAGYTALMSAAYHDNPEIAQQLIDNGAYINQHSNGVQALHMALSRNCPETANLLIKNGASLLLVDKKSIAYKEILKRVENWQKTAHCDPPSGLWKEDPGCFRGKAFEAVKAMLAMENCHGTAANKIAFAATAIFGTEQRVLQYVQKWGEAGKQPLHDIFDGIKMPHYYFGFHSGYNLKSWGDAALKCGPGMARLSSFANELPQPEKSSDGKTWSYPNTRDEAAPFAYRSGLANPELARICFEYSMPEKDFETACGLVIRQKKDILKNIPQITIDGKSFDMDGASFHPLAANDVRGLVLGHITNCCQSIGGPGEACAINGFMSENSGFYVLEKGKEILGQTWAWRGKKGELVFDSIETLGKRVTPDQWEKLATAFAKALKKSAPDVAALHIGTAGGTPKRLRAAFNPAAAPAQPVDYDGYRDSHKQVVVWKKPRARRVYSHSQK